MKNLRVKVIGAGSIGNHLTQAARRMGWSVTVVDRDPEALRRMREGIYPSRYGSWDDSIELFESGNEPKGGFDIIFIGTPPHVRMSLALEALKEKPRLLQLEKPLCAPTLEGLDNFKNSYFNQTHTLCVVGYDHAISPSITFVRDLLSHEVIGKIETIDVEFREYWGGIFDAHPWLSGPEDSYLGFTKKGGGASCEHSHALHLFHTLAQSAGVGSWNEVQSMFKFVSKNSYDSVASFVTRFKSGVIGRVIQDVVTNPPRKWARIQGSKGFIEWHCNGHESGDIVCWLSKETKGKPKEKVFPKTRQDDFYQEMLHIKQLLDKEIDIVNSPLAVESGIVVMDVLNDALTNNDFL